MERAAARCLQPHFVAAFFFAALEHLGGRYYVREPRRYEVTRVPREVRVRDRLLGPAAPLLERYERVTFHKELIAVPGRPVAEFVAPGHPLLDAVVDATLERTGDVLRRGAVLVDDDDPGTDVRLMACLEHAIRDARPGAGGEPRIVSRRLQFVELDAAGALRAAGPAPYLDYRTVEDHELPLLAGVLAADWLRDETLEERCTSFAVATLAPEHLAEVEGRTLERIVKTERAVRERLTAEAAHWDRRAEDLRAQEQAGKQPRMNWQNARRRFDELTRRLDERMAQLERERALAALPPRVIGGAVIIPCGLLDRLVPDRTPPAPAVDRDVIEHLAVEAVLAAEEALGRHPREMPPSHPGFDVESLDPETGRLYFIEVKGHGGGSDTVTVSRTQIFTALNTPETWILAIVEVIDGEAGEPRYLMRPFTKEPEFFAASVNYELKELLSRAVRPPECRGVASG